jgi:hypothetical protein
MKWVNRADQYPSRLWKTVKWSKMVVVYPIHLEVCQQTSVHTH